MRRLAAERAHHGARELARPGHVLELGLAAVDVLGLRRVDQLVDAVHDPGRGQAGGDGLRDSQRTHRP